MTLANDARFWNKAARKYARSRIADEAGYQRTLKRVRAYLGQADRVLELGCGTGSTALVLAEAVGHYTATDLSAEMIAIAQQKQSAEPDLPLDFQEATAETVADAFDVVLGFSYLHLVADPRATLGRIHDLLVPGGLFISKTPCVGEMNFLIRKVMLPVMQFFGKAPGVALFDAKSLQAMITEMGFDIEVVEYHASKGADQRPFIVARRPA